MSMKMSLGMNAFPKTSIACMRGCTDMHKAHFHLKRPCASGWGTHGADVKQDLAAFRIQFYMGNNLIISKLRGWLGHDSKRCIRVLTFNMILYRNADLMRIEMEFHVALGQHKTDLLDKNKYEIDRSAYLCRRTHMI